MMTIEELINNIRRGIAMGATREDIVRYFIKKMNIHPSVVFHAYVAASLLEYDHHDKFAG